MNRNYPRDEGSSVASMLAVLSIAVACPAVLATSPGIPIATSLEGLVDEAGVVGEFEVESQHAAMADLLIGEQEFRGLFTFVTFRVLEVLKGEVATATITLRFPGGAQGRIGSFAGDAMEFENGERVILFINDAIDDNTFYPLVEVDRSRFTIETDPSTGREYVLNSWGVIVTGLDPESGELTAVPGPARKDIGRIGPRGRRVKRERADLEPSPQPVESQVELPESLSPEELRVLIRSLVEKI